MPRPYSVRISKRAKSPRFRILPGSPPQLEVVIPKGMPKASAALLVRTHTKQIERLFQRYAKAQSKLENQAQAAETLELPDEIALPAIDRCIQIQYDSAKRCNSLEEWHVQVAKDDPLAPAYLQEWLKLAARSSLPEQLAPVAQRVGTDYQRVSVRLQRSRWGSRSSRGTISLNAALILQPPELMHSVLVHELCHGFEMNHSARFWAHVAEHDPDYLKHRESLKLAWRGLPGWVFQRA